MPDAWPESNFTFWKEDSGNSLAKSTGVTKKSRKNALPSNKVLYMHIGKLPKINGVGCASHLIIFCPVAISGFPMWMVFPFFVTIIWHKYLTLSCIYICICISTTCSCTVWVNIYAVLDFQKKSWGQLAPKFSFFVARTSILVAKNYITGFSFVKDNGLSLVYVFPKKKVTYLGGQAWKFGRH